ncbi:unnamed protein product, partial [Prunus brigantina]
GGESCLWLEQIMLCICWSTCGQIEVHDIFRHESLLVPYFKLFKHGSIIFVYYFHVNQ